VMSLSCFFCSDMESPRTHRPVGCDLKMYILNQIENASRTDCSPSTDTRTRLMKNGLAHLGQLNAVLPRVLANAFLLVATGITAGAMGTGLGARLTCPTPHLGQQIV
jgi:hypothetical protein